MLSWNRRTGWIVGLASIAAYFSLAEWSRRSFVDLTPKGKVVIQLFRPFEVQGNVALSNPPNTNKLREFADDENDWYDSRSPVVIYENGKPLGPAHNSYADIRDHGMGRFSFWRNTGFVFTASDNSDPNTNGRNYWAVLPDAFVDVRGKVVIELFPPFEMHGNVAVSNPPAANKLRDFADDENDRFDRRSPVVIYENGKPLGPAHNSYADIRDLGMGRFSFWRHSGFVFTASDNSDPSTNGRSYSAVLPE
jgi:hypothetical protein